MRTEFKEGGVVDELYVFLPGGAVSCEEGGAGWWHRRGECIDFMVEHPVKSRGHSWTYSGTVNASAHEVGASFIPTGIPCGDLPSQTAEGRRSCHV